MENIINKNLNSIYEILDEANGKTLTDEEISQLLMCATASELDSVETIELEMVNNIIKEATLNLCKDINCNCKYSEIHTSVLEFLEEVDKRLAQVSDTRDADTLLLDQIVTNLVKLNREYYDFLMKKLALPSKRDIIDVSKLISYNQIHLQINNKISSLKNGFQIEETVTIETEDDSSLIEENNENKIMDDLAEKFNKIGKYFCDLLYGNNGNNFEIKSLVEFNPLYDIFSLDLQDGLENITSEEIQESDIFNIYQNIKKIYLAIMQALEEKKKSCNNIWNSKKNTNYFVYSSFQKQLKRVMDYIKDTISELEIKMETEGIEDSNIKLPDSTEKIDDNDGNYFPALFYDIEENHLNL